MGVGRNPAGCVAVVTAVVPGTLTVTVRVVAPPGPVAVKVYVVVVAGTTRRVPRVATTPIPGSIVSEYAFETSQRSVEDESRSARSVAGSAENSWITTGGLGGGVPGNPAGGGACASADVAPTSSDNRVARAFIRPATFPRGRTWRRGAPAGMRREALRPAR